MAILFLCGWDSAPRGTEQSMRRPLVLAFPFLVLLAAHGLCGEPAIADTDAEKARRDVSPPSMSLYLPIPLSIPNVEQQSTGVFVPADYRPGDRVDLVVFLRGYDNNRPTAATSVEEYWKSPDHPILKSFGFREEPTRAART